MNIASVAELLESAIEKAENDLQRQLDAEERMLPDWWPKLTPWERRDSNGRYILLDAVVALAQLKAAQQ